MKIKTARLVMLLLMVVMGIGNSMVVSPLLHDKSTKLTLNMVVLVATIVLAILLVVNESRKE